MKKYFNLSLLLLTLLTACHSRMRPPEAAELKQQNQKWIFALEEYQAQMVENKEGFVNYSKMLLDTLGTEGVNRVLADSTMEARHTAIENRHKSWTSNQKKIGDQLHNQVYDNRTWIAKLNHSDISRNMARQIWEEKAQKTRLLFTQTGKISDEARLLEEEYGRFFSEAKKFKPAPKPVYYYVPPPVQVPVQVPDPVSNPDIPPVVE